VLLAHNGPAAVHAARHAAEAHVAQRIAAHSTLLGPFAVFAKQVHAGWLTSPKQVLLAA
jgi:hypothetical protein